MSNFEFLKQNRIFSNFSEACLEAENGIGLNTVTCCILSRRALELGVKWLYANDNDLVIPYQDNLSALVHDITFKRIVDEKLLKQIEYIIKIGNFAVHNNKKISREEAILSLRYLHNFMQWISYCYSDNFKEKEFDESILQIQSLNILTTKEREKLYKELEEKDKKLEETRKENAELRNKLTEKRVKNEEKYDFEVKEISEYETRKKYIDLELKLAGWDFDSNVKEELKVSGMPNNKKEGQADYVLVGKNGLPLAVVEAKRTSVDPRVGQNQAKLYADCLENEYQQRPIIYYTNGFEIYMWDDMNYAPRKVAGFYTQDELQLLINRRRSKQSLEHIFVDDKITNREYQLEAIKSVCETFEEGHRKALLVMATGTGKTRTAISIVDVLTDKEWVKNVLFLADRTVLVKQAKNNFTDLLPNISTCNLLTTTDNPEDSRIVFSTYQTMMNAIDTAKNKSGNKLFTPGHFDLIIVDEAHRSIYKKYQAIFEYFDGLVVGLTATPRNDVDRNTYRFFEIENDVPTFAYEYETAVKEGYLTDYHTIKTTTNFMDRGIKYSELSEEEKEEYENTFTDEDELPEAVESSAINSWFFNRDTIKKLLELLMEKGLKIKGGDELGKTIIFARNHKHAEYIVEVFNQLYPMYKGQFAKLIDNQVKYNESIIEEFSTKDKWPQIAVSVDMLDTGVDVPEILNLVFFKPVKSKIKFWQMIGRGTRLCKNLYGKGVDKKEFYIFDYCKNFEFFSENPKGIESNSGSSLTEKIYGYKIDLIVELQNLKYQNDDKYCNFRNNLIEEFVSEINKLNPDSFMVKNKKQYIEQYSKKDNWNYISTIDLMDIKNNLIPLFISIDDNEEAKRFDNLIYQLQIKKIREDKTERYENSIIDVVEKLEKLGTIPQVREKQELILKVAETDYIKQSNFWEIENIRCELRNLIQFIDPENRPIVITDKFKDSVNEIDEDDIHVTTGYSFNNYRKKIEKFLIGNLENVIIWKIRHNVRLTEQDKENLEKILFEELGNNKEFAQAFGDTNIIKAVRNIVGLDASVVSDIFYKYINDNRLNMKQIQFVKLLVDYVIKNGTIDMKKLKEQPFKNVGEIYDLFGNNIDLFKEIREDIESINENAEKLA